VLAMTDRIVANGHLFPFFFYLFSLENYNLTLFVICISTSVLILLILNFFFLEPLIEVLFIFNFILPSQFAIYYFFSIWFFFFFRPLVELIFFSISLFNQIFFYFLFHFYPHSFDCFFSFSSINVSFQFHPSIKNKIYFVF
jgi:hypothetical protein